MHGERIARRIAVLLNPAAGSGDVEQVEQLIADSCARAGIDHVVRSVAGPDLAAAARRAVADGYNVIATGGGDGTLSTVASVLVEGEAALGVLPLGTLNHFAKDLGIPLDLKESVSTIVKGKPLAVDVGEVNGHIFINNSSLGVYPRVVEEREQEQRKGRRKLVALAVAVARVWQRYPRIAVLLHANGEPRLVRTPFLFVGNGEYTLEGVELGSRKELTSGRLHVCLAPGVWRAEAVRLALAALAGRLHLTEKFESIFDTEVAVEAKRPMRVSLDGEVRVLRTPLRYRVRPRALRVIVPNAQAPAKE